MTFNKAIQICGTGSGVGKSVITCGLCRIFLEDGYSVAPFKAQNMALNSFVTEEKGEIGRAQATQAKACKIRPTVDMNPVLIKPTADTRAQIILWGKPVGNMSVYEYKDYKKMVFGKIKESLRKLKQEYEITVIEGAGSPAEINLKSHDLVNLRIAKLANAPVILVGDIDKGGVFAWLIGTLELLSKEERKMIKGFIINKFRGDKRLLMSGINFLEKYTGIKTLGVIPYFHNIKIPEEDSVSIEAKKKNLESNKKIKIDVIYLPHISNFDDFDALEGESDVSLKYIGECRDLRKSDVIIIPGTKNSIEDLDYLKKTGLAKKIVSTFKSNSAATLVGICGGYQMLGEKIYDKKNLESKRKEINGLEILPVITEIYAQKVVSQVKAKHLSSGIEISGYEIHQGRTKVAGNSEPAFEVIQFNHTGKFDGAITDNGRCWGTYLHGVFDSNKFRRYFLNNLRKKKGWKIIKKGINYDVDREIGKLASLLRKNIDLNLLYEILDKKERGRSCL